MLVSIVVPFYNVEPYFRRCLDSIVNQSYRDLEIILVDDCSPDKSIEIANEYAEKDSRIKIIEHELNKGLGGARNTGLSVAKGEYLWFIDSDDEISTPFAVEHLVAVAKRDQSDVIFFRAQRKFIDQQKDYLYGDYKYEEEQIFNPNAPFYPIYLDVVLNKEDSYVAFTPSACFKFFKVSFLKQHRFQFLEQTVHEDLVVIIFLALAERVTQLPYVFYYYYMREGSIMNSNVPKNYIDHFGRIANQLWGVYDSYWGNWLKRENVIPTLLISHLAYNTHRIAGVLSNQEYRHWLVEIYDFLQRELAPRGDFSQMNPWPKVITKPEQWKRVLRSFPARLSADKKIKLMNDALPRRNTANPFTKILKMLMPYGVIRWRQIQKDRRRA